MRKPFRVTGKIERGQPVAWYLRQEGRTPRWVLGLVKNWSGNPDANVTIVDEQGDHYSPFVTHLYVMGQAAPDGTVPIPTWRDAESISDAVTPVLRPKRARKSKPTTTSPATTVRAAVEGMVQGFNAEGKRTEWGDADIPDRRSYRNPWEEPDQINDIDRPMTVGLDWMPGMYDYLVRSTETWKDLLAMLRRWKDEAPSYRLAFLLCEVAMIEQSAAAAFLGVSLRTVERNLADARDQVDRVMGWNSIIPGHSWEPERDRTMVHLRERVTPELEAIGAPLHRTTDRLRVRIDANERAAPHGSEISSA
jgi:hypothetical protein